MRCDMRVVWVALAVAGASLLAGCSTDRRPPDLGERVETSPAMPLAAERDPVLDLLDYAAQLRQATPEARAEAVAVARAQVASRPDAQSYAHLALAFGTAGQRRYTPDEAARYAQRALTADDAQWSPAACQYLQDLARLYAEGARNGAASSTDTVAEPAPAIAEPVIPESATRSARAQPPAGQSNARERAHIRELERELDEARRKLRELADIENRLGDPGT
ncbi:hypothetical protein [Salinisphaera sp. S4-8]|uniref:hypothetical protein n=1 Tax=Salinisphaera sp. S4-8 TaxID=633357 RepID=UPI003340E37E